MLIEHLNRRRREREAQSLRRVRRVAESACAPHQQVSVAGAPARALLAFCSNDYLGLANHPLVIDALAEGARRYGAGSGASHLVSGHSRAHQALEEALAACFAPFIPGAQALGFGTGYLANLALLDVLGRDDATIFADKLNHASLVDAALLAGAGASARAKTSPRPKPMFRRYAHGRLDVLERELAACTSPIRLIITDAVFSMDGDLADLPALLALAERHDAWLVLDDAHGFGVLGAEGQGSLAHFGLCSERFIVMGTLGKAAGVGGAFVAAHPAVIDALLQTARAYVYTTAAPPAIAHAALAGLSLIQGDEGKRRRAALMSSIASLRRQLGELIAACPSPGDAMAGAQGGPPVLRPISLPASPPLRWRLADSTTAIQPLVVGDNAAALALSADLESQGLWVPAIRPPTVPAGSARLRITLSAAHTEADIARLVDALGSAAHECR